MLSLSDNEFSVVNFLVRNFSEKFTIRNVAQKLNFSPAGVFNILKKLEKESIVVGQKLGTGLFYAINFENKIAEHLACVALLYSSEKISLDIEQLKQAKAALFDKKTLLLITDNIATLDLVISNISIVTKSQDEFATLLRKKDQEMLQLLKKGIVLFGEDKIVEVIKNCISRF